MDETRKARQGRRGLWIAAGFMFVILVVVIWAWLLPAILEAQAASTLHAAGGEVETEPRSAEWLPGSIGERLPRVINVRLGSLRRPSPYSSIDSLIDKGKPVLLGESEWVAVGRCRGLRQLTLDNTAATDAGLERVKGLTRLQRLNVSGTAVTDTGLVHLKGFTSLERLDLSGTAVTDAGLVHLKGLTNLTHLYIGSTSVTGAGLEHLKGLNYLQWLDLNDTAVIDAGLVHLKGLTILMGLYLDGTGVTDAGLEHVKGFASLWILHLRNTAVTDAGVAELKQAKPDLKIER